MIPLGPADVPPGSVLRQVMSPPTYWVAIAGVCSVVLRLASGEEIEWEALQKDGWLIKRPGCVWVKCEKPKKKT
jgi:hypothetical protein